MPLGFLDAPGEHLNSETALVFENRDLSTTCAALIYEHGLAYCRLITPEMAATFKDSDEALYKAPQDPRRFLREANVSKCQCPGAAWRGSHADPRRPNIQAKKTDAVAHEHLKQPPRPAAVGEQAPASGQ
jgi:hypothetical protein